MITVTEDRGIGAWVWRGGGLSSRFGLYGTDRREGKVVLPVAEWFARMERAVDAYRAYDATGAQSRTLEGDALAARLARLVNGLRQGAWIDAEGVIVSAADAEALEAAAAELRHAAANGGAVAQARQRRALDGHEARMRRAVALHTDGTMPLPATPAGIMSSREAARRAVLAALAGRDDNEVPTSMPVGRAVDFAATPTSTPLVAPASRVEPPRSRWIAWGLVAAAAWGTWRLFARG